MILDVLGLPFDARPDALGGASVADVLLEPTIIYAPAFRALGGVAWKAAAHITGGGLVENPPRIFSGDDLAVELDPATWTVPAVMTLIAGAGVDESEMRRTFNGGLGMLIVVAPGDADRAIAALAPWQGRAVGRLVPRGSGAPARFVGDAG